MPSARMRPQDRVIVDADHLTSLFAALRSCGYRIIGPTVSSGAIVLQELATSADFPGGWTDCQANGSYRLGPAESRACFSHGPGPQTWKHWLYPPHTRLFQATHRGAELLITPADAEQPRLALLGLRACDLHALARLDRVLMEGYADPMYAERRRQALIIAVPCRNPGANCFCLSMGTGPELPPGFDLALTEVLEGDRHYFVAQVASDRAAEVLASGLDVRSASREERQAAALVVEETSARMARRLDPGKIREHLLDQIQDPGWEDAGTRCLACGNCTLVCPTCFCTTVEDSTDLAGVRAERWRRWDSCFSRDFSYIHGAVVRATPWSRYRHRLLHKFVTWVDQFGAFGCVGCGRCITWCPAGLDLIGTINQIGGGEVNLR